MLAAMARGARTQYANRVNLVTVPAGQWTVPAGVTSVNVYGYTRGGQPPATGASVGKSGGGGGAAILNVPLTVTPADILQVSVTGTVTQQIVVQNGFGVTLFQLSSGSDTSGGSVTWYQGGTVAATGGAYVATAGTNGGDGQRVACLTGWLLSGGGGGTGGTLFPVQQGGRGGNSGTFAGIQDATVAGGAGGGFFPGQWYRDNVTLTPSGLQTSEVWVEW